MKRAIVILSGLTLIFFFCLAAFAFDPPHNESSGVYCGSCHGQSLEDSQGNPIDSPFWDTGTSSDEAYNAVCLRCHVTDPTLGNYGENSAPLVKSHAPNGTNIRCTKCHHNHYQEQLDIGNYNQNNFFIAKGTGSALSYSSGETTIQVTSIRATNPSSDWASDLNKLADKTNLERGALLVPRRSYSASRWPMFTIKSMSITPKTGDDDKGTVDGTITVKGNVSNTAEAKARVADFGIFYGQQLRGIMETTSGNYSYMEFYDKTGAYGLTTENSPYDGICQVCHENTDHFRSSTAPVDPGAISLTATHNMTNNGYKGTNCSRCHSHTDEFTHFGYTPTVGDPDTDECIDCHGHTAGYEYDPIGNPGNLSPGKGSFESHAKHTEELGLACDECHDMAHFPLFKSGPASEDPWDFSKTDVCNRCHFVLPTSWKGSVCTSCHSGQASEHGVSAARAPVAFQLSNGNSHHVQLTAEQIAAGEEISGEHCYQCHWEADVNGRITSYHGGENNPGSAVDLVVHQDEDTLSRATLDPNNPAHRLQYTADGSRSQIASLNTHCLGCHDDDSSDDILFGDDKTPKQYAWDNNSVDARYSQTGTTPWGKYSGVNVTPKNQRTKALSAHGYAVGNEGGWDLSEGWPNKRNGGVNVACFDCHNSHGSSVTGPTTSYASATTNGGILKDTIENTGGYGVTYKPVAGGAPETKNEHNAGAALCFDCHLTMDGSAANTPWGYQETFEESQAIIGYFDSEFLAPGVVGPQQRYAYKWLSQNAGGHLWASSRIDADNSGMNTTPMHSINGLCTPCHDPHGVSPTHVGTCDTQSYVTKSDCDNALGSGHWTPNQDYGVPMLKGTWVTSPYKEDAAPGETNLYVGQSGWNGRSNPGYNIDQNTFVSPWNFASTSGINENANKFAGLCLQCHLQGDINPNTDSTWGTMDRIHNTVKGWDNDGTTKHRFSCSKCHSPHNGSALPRLMVTNCLDYRHRGRVGSGGVAVNHSDTGSGDSGSGSGSGKFPAGGSGAGSGDGSSSSYKYAFGNQSCHDSVGSGSWPDNQFWNQVTSWENDSHAPPQFTNIRPEPDTVCTAATCFNSVAWYATKAPDGDPVEYQVEVDDNADFSSVGFTSAWLSSATLSYGFTAPTDANGKTWFWRVKSRDSVDTTKESIWSEVDDFFINYKPPRPNRIAEPDQICISDCLVTLQWNAVVIFDGHSPEYYVEIDDNADFSSPEYETVGWISGLTFNATLATQKTWYWHVHARDSVHTSAVSDWSTSDAFILTASPPQPTFIAEPDSRCAPDCSLTLEWNAVTAPDGHAVEYNVQITNVSRPYTADWTIYADPNLQTSGWISGASWTVTVATDSTWYWHVRARDASTVPNHTGRISLWSTNDSFAVTGTPATPVLIDEPDILCPSGSCLDITLDWNAVTSLDGDVIEYYVQVDDNSDFSSPEYETAGWITDVSLDITVVTDTNYYWHVQARDSGSPSGHPDTTWVSAWSATDGFAVKASNSPPAPTNLLSPLTYDSSVSSVVGLSWDAVTDPDGDPVEYLVQVDDDPAFNSPNYISGWRAPTNWNVTVLSCYAWYWRVRSRDAAHIASMSAWATFGTYFYDISANCDTSCPVLFAWDGEKFAFESDIYPAGKLGNLEPDGFRKPNPYDYYLLGTDLDLLNGRYELRLVEERMEANFLDKLTLYAVDYPADRDLYAERLHVSLGTYVEPAGVLHTTGKQLQAPVSATHVETGEDVTDIISHSDDSYVVLSNDRDYDFGWQTLEIDLGDLGEAPMVKLIIDGQTAFPITHEGHMVASQEPKKSSLKVLDGSGNWVPVPMKERSMVPREDGGPIAVDITNIFKANVYKIRIGYFYKTYIRSILFDTTMDEPVTINEVPVATAVLRRHGHDKKYGGEIGEYVYDDISSPDPEYLPGRYTRFGDVSPLLIELDDKFVNFGSGDEVTLRYNNVGENPFGESRKFLLYSNGYYKSLSNNNVPHTVEPLPFADMSNFPYDETIEHYPDDTEHVEYLDIYNTRVQ